MISQGSRENGMFLGVVILLSVGVWLAYAWWFLDFAPSKLGLHEQILILSTAALCIAGAGLLWGLLTLEDDLVKRCIQSLFLIITMGSYATLWLYGQLLWELIR